MRIKWHCHYCRKDHYHVSMDKQEDERRPVRSAQRNFCDEVCLGKYESIGKEKAHA